MYVISYAICVCSLFSIFLIWKLRGLSYIFLLSIISIQCSRHCFYCAPHISLICIFFWLRLKYFKISLVISSLIHVLSKSIFLNLWILGYFPSLFLLFIFSLITFWFDGIVFIIFIFKNLLRCIFWLKMSSTLLKIPC